MLAGWRQVAHFRFGSLKVLRNREKFKQIYAEGGTISFFLENKGYSVFL